MVCAIAQDGSDTIEQPNLPPAVGLGVGTVSGWSQQRDLLSERSSQRAPSERRGFRRTFHKAAGTLRGLSLEGLVVTQGWLRMWQKSCANGYTCAAPSFLAAARIILILLRMWRCRCGTLNFVVIAYRLPRRST
jgi:hypothetical protein